MDTFTPRAGKPLVLSDLSLVLYGEILAERLARTTPLTVAPAANHWPLAVNGYDLAVPQLEDNGSAPC